MRANASTSKLFIPGFLAGCQRVKISRARKKRGVKRAGLFLPCHGWFQIKQDLPRRTLTRRDRAGGGRALRGLRGLRAAPCGPKCLLQGVGLEKERETVYSWRGRLARSKSGPRDGAGCRCARSVRCARDPRFTPTRLEQSLSCCVARRDPAALRVAYPPAGGRCRAAVAATRPKPSRSTSTGSGAGPGRARAISSPFPSHSDEAGSPHGHFAWGQFQRAGWTAHSHTRCRCQPDHPLARSAPSAPSPHGLTCEALRRGPTS